MRSSSTRAVVSLISALVLVAVVETEVTPRFDWPQWRGPDRSGVSHETGLAGSWPSGGPRLAWRATGAGGGYSSMAVVDGRLYTLGSRGDTEFLVALDVATGEKLWEAANGPRLRNDRGDGPRSTPTVDGGRVFVLGSRGDLSAFEVASGNRLWSKNVLSEFGGSNPTWGMSESPLVVGDRLIVNAGGRDASVVALRTTDGAVIWKTQSDGAGYSSAVLAEVGGFRQAVVFTSRRAIGVAVDDGRLLWEYAKVSNRVANVATPIVRGDRVFVSSDYGTGGALLSLARRGDGMEATEQWFSRNMRNHHSSSVLVGDLLYGFSSAILTAMRFDTGEVVWRDRSVGKGSLVAADGRLYLFGENGTVGLADATPEGYRERGRFRIDTGALPTWSHPVVANGRLYLRDQDTIYAYDVGSS